VQRTARVLPGSLPGLGLPVHPAPAADDPLDMVSRAGAADREQPRLGLGRGHAGQGPDLGVGELAAGEGLGQPGQRAQSARHPHMLAGRAGGEPHPPGEPGGAGAKAGVPAFAGVELAEEIEEAAGRGIQMRRQLGDWGDDGPALPASPGQRAPLSRHPPETVEMRPSPALKAVKRNLFRTSAAPRRARATISPGHDARVVMRPLTPRRAR